MLTLSALITGNETVGDHTEFIVQISCNGVVWLISRRFSDFDQLHQRLLRRFGDLIEASLPEKQWFGRFDPNFLAKRQLKLQEYLDSVLQVPGILEDRSLSHFLEVERNLDFQGDYGSGGVGVGRGGMAASGNLSAAGTTSKSGILSENDRLTSIVELAAHAFIDISEVPEPLEPDQVLQRKNEIVVVASSQNNLNDARMINEQFHSLQCFKAFESDQIAHTSKKFDRLIAILEEQPQDDSYETNCRFLETQISHLLSKNQKKASPSLELVCSISADDSENAPKSNVSSASSNTIGTGQQTVE